MAKATLNKYGIATKAGDITVYNYNSETREYLSSAVEFLAVGVGIPAHSCTDAPVEQKEGFAVCRTASLDGWEYISDHREETVYDKQTGRPVELTALGNYPDSVTTTAPSTLYDKWNGSTWVTDAAALRNAAIADAEKQRSHLLSSADKVMLDWRTELMLGEISDANRAKLSAWMAYKNEIKAVDVTTDPEHVIWPEPPEA